MTTNQNPGKMSACFTTEAGTRVGISPGWVLIDDEWYEMSDFLVIASTVITGIDIDGDDDPRIPFVDHMKAMQLYGSDKGHPHFASQLPPVLSSTTKQTQNGSEAQT